MSDESHHGCGSINACIAIIGDKWTGLIIRELSSGAGRFTQLEQRLSIGPRTLSQRLDSLEEQGIISKTHFAESPPRIEYTLTKKGEDILPILEAMAAWGIAYPAKR